MAYGIEGAGGPGHGALRPPLAVEQRTLGSELAELEPGLRNLLERVALLAEKVAGAEPIPADVATRQPPGAGLLGVAMMLGHVVNDIRTHLVRLERSIG